MVTLKLDSAPWIDIGIAVVNSCFADSHWHFAELLEQIIKDVQVSRIFYSHRFRLMDKVEFRIIHFISHFLRFFRCGAREKMAWWSSDVWIEKDLRPV